MAPDRWLHAITIIYPDAGCQGVSSPAWLLLLQRFREPVDRYSHVPSAHGALSSSALRSPQSCLVVLCRKTQPRRLLPSADSWEVTSGALLSACLSVQPHLSLFAKAFRSRPSKSVRQMGGRLLACRTGNTICSPQCSASEPRNARMANRCNAMHGPDSLKNPCLCLPSVGLLQKNSASFIYPLK